MTATSILPPVKFCKKCQCETEWYKCGSCKPCKAAQRKQKRKEFPEKFREKSIQWKKDNPEKVKASYADYYLRNKSKIGERTSAYNSKNRDKLRVAAAESRALNPEKARTKNRNRRARKLNAGGVLSKSISVKLYKLQRGKCACCGLLLGSNYHLDHIMPLVLGGSNTDDNVQLLRQRCNNQKNSKHPVDFMQERGFLL